jgi:signal transduction histidine kinase
LKGLEDNGARFNPADMLSMMVRTGRFGLFGIWEQLEELGGHPDIKSTPGQAARIIVTAPLK